jgi:protocatechuate 3,4-dioxygenase beta subunit
MTLAGLVLLMIVTQSPAGGSLAGRVTDRATGLPAPRVLVTLIAGAAKTQATTLTGDDGRYRFAAVPPGDYAVLASNDDHKSTYLMQVVGDDTPMNPLAPRVPRLNVHLLAGEERDGLDVALTRALGIEGRVLDSWGEPIALAEVTIIPAGSRSFPIASRRTDDMGRYRGFNLPPGRYRVCAEASRDIVNPATADLPKMGRTCYPSASSDGDAAEIALTAQDVTDIDVRMQRSGSRSISGTVVDASGALVDGASLQAWLPSADWPRGDSGALTRAGAFAIKGLLPDRYELRASIGGSRPGDPGPPAREREEGFASADLTGGDAEAVTITLSKPVSVTGVVRFEGTAAPAGRSLHMTVTAQAPTGPSIAFEGPPLAPVGDDLSFTLGGLYHAPATIALRGLPAGWAVKSVRYGDRDITHDGVDFTALPNARLEVAVTNAVARVSVRVATDQGDRVAAATVVALPADPARWKTAAAVFAENVPENGIFRLAPLLPGEYFVAALTADDAAAMIRKASRIAGVAAIGTRIAVTAGETRTLTVNLRPLPDR